MKSLMLALTGLCLLTCNYAFASETLTDVQKKHRKLRHEEGKTWAKMEAECRTKYPRGHDPNDKDYDAKFKCDEDVKDARQAFEDKLNQEICEKFRISCKKD